MAGDAHPAVGEVTGGEVFHDGLATLIQARDRLRWYPRDVWFYVLACQWRRIGQEEPLVGRCGELDDHVGSGEFGSPTLLVATGVKYWSKRCFA